jgi:5-formyltetrahydrofolate cyclo-ligase
VTLGERKRDLRSAMRSARNALSGDDRRLWSETICDQLADLVAHSATVMVYAAIRSEVDVAAFAHRHPGSVVFPRVEGEQLVAVANDGEMVVSSFGVPEPAGPAIERALIDAVIVPGLGFDAGGRRLGYGAGFYDRFLPQLRPSTITIGVGFDCQICDEIPVDDHDRLLDLVVTERGVITRSTIP